MTTEAKKLVRQADGSLVEQVVPEVAGGGPLGQLAPSTPKGAAAQGATPQSAAMIGTPAQKTNALTQAAKAGTELGQVERQVGSPTQMPPAATETASRAKELSGSLSTLGTYGTRVQGLIKARLDVVEAQAAQATVNTEQVGLALAGQSADTKTAAQAALDTYAKSGSEADLAKLRDMFGGDKLAGGGLERLYQGSPEQLAALAQRGQGEVTIGQLDLGAGGMNPAQLAQDLGVDIDTLNGMSPAQFQQAVQDTLNRSLSSTDALHAEYRKASPARQAQILEQLRAADQTGLSAAEAAASHLAEQLGQAQSVRFAGQAYDIQELLKSDKVSTLIKQAAANPAALEQLKASEPELAAWIAKNQASLSTFNTHNEEQRAALEGTQTQAAALTADLTPELKAALAAAGLAVPTGTQTAAQVAALKASLEGNAVVQAVRASPDVKAALQANPSLAKPLADAGLTAAAIQDLAATSKAVFADPTLTKYLGLAPGQGLIDPARLADVQETAAAWAKLPGDVLASAGFQSAVRAGMLQGADGIDVATFAGALLQDPDVADLIDRGLVATPAALRQLAYHPGILQTIKATAAEHDELEALAADATNPATMAQITQRMFGKPLTYDDVKSVMTYAGGVDDYYNGDPVAQHALAVAAKTFDLDGDGTVTPHDFTPGVVADRLRTRAAQLPNARAILGGKSSADQADPFTTAQQALGGKDWQSMVDGAARAAASGDAARIRAAKEAEAKAAADAAAAAAAAIARSEPAPPPTPILEPIKSSAAGVVNKLNNPLKTIRGVLHKV